MGMNPITIFLTALIPLVIGFIWYHEKVFGSAWQKGSGLTAEMIAKGPKPIVFLIAYIFGLMAATALHQMVVHQSGLMSLFVNLEGFGQEGSAVQQQFEALTVQFQDHHRTFGHGAFHGAMYGIFFALPVLATNGMFEQRTWKFNFINVGYWTVCLTLMGGVQSQFG